MVSVLNHTLADHDHEVDPILTTQKVNGTFHAAEPLLAVAPVSRAQGRIIGFDCVEGVTDKRIGCLRRGEWSLEFDSTHAQSAIPISPHLLLR